MKLLTHRAKRDNSTSTLSKVGFFLQYNSFWSIEYFISKYSKTCVKWPLAKRPKIGFQDQLLLNAGQKYCRYLQYFLPSLSYHLSLRSLFLCGRFTQVLLYSSIFVIPYLESIEVKLAPCQISVTVAEQVLPVYMFSYLKGHINLCVFKVVSKIFSLLLMVHRFS